MKTTRPALDKELAFQLVSLKFALLERFLNTYGEGRPWKMVHPRYLPNDELVGMFKTPLICCLSRGVFLEKTIRDLSNLINCPD